MSVVYFASAAINERHTASGGIPGDQPGWEVRWNQPFYVHEKGWAVIRAKDPKVRAAIAYAVKRACDNNKIGYDQTRRLDLYNRSKPFGFDPGKVTVPSDCDCSSLLRTALAHAGINVVNFRTINEIAVLKATGKFYIYYDAAYTRSSDRLMKGDILCTLTSGHTGVIMNDGPLAGVPLPPPEPLAPPFSLNDVPVLHFGDANDAVAYMQMCLAKQGSKYALPLSVDKRHRYGYDGHWGIETRIKFAMWQKAAFPNDRSEWDNQCGPHCWTKLIGKLCR